MLKGEKIYLRSVEKRDMSIFYSFCEEEEVRKFDGGHKIMPALERVMQSFDEMTNNRRDALSIINEKNVLVGYMTFKEKMDTINVYSIGITIGSRYWNRGYGKDSIKTLLDYLFMYRAAQRVELEVVDYNERAINCYKSCGFIKEGTKRKSYFSNGKYHDVFMMGILSEEYKDGVIKE
ncbi:GNAT family N-acetyltransferase [Clostridium fallax]|uniref:Protein N-acetyltransferase, RimJ/RimL family n=1 Tax=Clostridium fallax TaxID=1533 RepID=A0A1M4W2N1_9CLOT|nr:GNAT family protein [Clostridium fallax]SHE75222.1 Protein N-acetyltransferase, RimJ/RimL family [Clostridium fallax]SQB22837.1 GNAT family acetyltransferase [Clostridium fallax]